MKNTLLSTLVVSTLSLTAIAQNVNIPDANFKNYLVGNSTINTNGDTEIQVSEAANVSGNLMVNTLGITDLTGIEAFTSITGLYCSGNNLGTLDLSANTALTYIDCQSANLTSIDITNCTALTGINCFFNNLTSLDVTNNTALNTLNCSNNNLTNLNVSNNALLSNFSCDNNDLTSLDVSNNTALAYFVCHFNELTTIDISNCTALNYFSCSGNILTSLDVSNNTSLTSLYCSVNSITYLDVSLNTSLVLLRCDDNDLSILNVANGNNSNFTMFIAYSNPNLTCIQVDDAAWSAANWTNIDATASFSTDCNYNIGINELNTESALMVYPNPTNSMIMVDFNQSIDEMNLLDITGKIIMNVENTTNKIDLSALKNGVYFLQIRSNNELFNERFIKN